jgi:hypothetical protein
MRWVEVEIRDESWLPVRAACGCAAMEFAYPDRDGQVLVAVHRCHAHRECGGPAEELVMELALVGSLRAPAMLPYLGYRCAWCAGGCGDCRANGAHGASEACDV